MTGLLLLAIGSDTPMKILAVLGGAAVGALLASGLVRLGVKATSGQNLPRPVAWGLRGLGGTILGWLVALWAFGGGGGGLGGEGGMGIGSGRGSGSGTEGPGGSQAAQIDQKDHKDDPFATEDEILRVEILGDSPLTKLAKGGPLDTSRRYRVTGESTLRNLNELRDLVRKRRKGQPALRRMEIIVYQDSPARERPVVADLAEWARDLEDEGKGRLRVDFAESDRYAPVE